MFVRMPRRRKTNPALSATGAGAAPPARGLEFLDDFSNPDLARYYEIVPGVGKFLAQYIAPQGTRLLTARIVFRVARGDPKKIVPL